MKNRPINQQVARASLVVIGIALIAVSVPMWGHVWSWLKTKTVYFGPATGDECSFLGLTSAQLEKARDRLPVVDGASRRGVFSWAQPIRGWRRVQRLTGVLDGKALLLYANSGAKAAEYDFDKGKLSSVRRWTSDGTLEFESTWSKRQQAWVTKIFSSSETSRSGGPTFFPQIPVTSTKTTTIVEKAGSLVIELR